MGGGAKKRKKIEDEERYNGTKSLCPYEGFMYTMTTV
jgi:hypothetical protein